MQSQKSEKASWQDKHLILVCPVEEISGWVNPQSDCCNQWRVLQSTIPRIGWASSIICFGLIGQVLTSSHLMNFSPATKAGGTTTCLSWTTWTPGLESAIVFQAVRYLKVRTRRQVTAGAAPIYILLHVQSSSHVECESGSSRGEKTFPVTRPVRNNDPVLCKLSAHTNLYY